MEIFCERLKELRLEKDLTVMQLSKLLGVAGTTVLRWENGDRIPSIIHLYIIAKFFDVTSDYLIGLEN